MGQRCSRTHNSKVCSLVHMLEISTCGEKRKNMDEDALITSLLNLLQRQNVLRNKSRLNPPPLAHNQKSFGLPPSCT